MIFLSLLEISKLKTLRRLLFTCRKTELLPLGIDRWQQFGVLFLRSKVSFYYVESFLVNFHIFVRLQELNLVKSCKSLTLVLLIVSNVYANT